MKTFTFQSVLLFLLCQLSTAQEYVPFPTEDASWHVYLESTCDNDNPAVPELLRYFLEGDTVIGDVMYSHLYVESGDTVNPVIQSKGGIREENMKVYYIGSGYIDPFEGEYLLYDFNAQVDDTIHHSDGDSWKYSVVLDIDSVEIGEVYRKRYLVDNRVGHHNPDYIIEGIGSVMKGLLGHISDIPTCGYHYWEHVCFYDQGEQVYRNPAYSDCFAGVYLDTVLHADAGSDIAVCSDNPDPVILGGYPAAMGGTHPYTYAWSATYEHAASAYTASSMLEDTTMANPVFKEGWIPDSAVFYLIVTDSKDNSAIDSVLVRQSRYVICLGECLHEINLGDSVQLGHCVGGGIPPLQFAWDHAETLSDPAVADPWAKPAATTTYLLTITDSIGCVISTSCKVFVNPSGMDVEDLTQKLKIYPNPAGDNLIIEFNHPHATDIRLEIVNTSGQTICNIPVHGSSVSLDTRDMSPGIYILFLKSGRKILDKGRVMID